MSTVIVSPLWGSIAWFAVINSRFPSLSCVKRGRRFLGKEEAPEHETNAIVKIIVNGDAKNWKIVDCPSPSIVVATVCSPSSMWFFSLSVVSAIHLVMGSDHLISFLSFHRDTVWDSRAIDKKFRLEKSIRAKMCSNYDLP